MGRQAHHDCCTSTPHPLTSPCHFLCHCPWAYAKAPPEPTTFALLHHLLHLPSPPQILYLPPLPSPLPASLVTILHTIKLAATNPAAQLHCEPLPPTVGGVRLFTRKWAAVAKGTTGEEGRRVDAIVMGVGWECALDSGPDGRAELLAEGDTAEEGGEEDNGEGTKWTTHQFHFHLLTSLLPSLLKAPAERDIRLISLVSPAWPAAVPRLEKQLASGPVDTDGEPSISAPKKASEAGMLERAGADGLTTFFFNAHFKLILDALASATYSQRAVPDPTAASGAKKVEVSSNIKALSVVMPWARDEVCRPLFGRVALGWLVWLLLYPLVLLFTPGPSMAVQSVLFALSAPVLYEEGGKVKVEFDKDGPKEGGKAIKEKGEQRESTEKAKEIVSKPTKIGDGAVTERRSGVKQGDVVRDCAVIE